MIELAKVPLMRRSRRSPIGAVIWCSACAKTAEVDRRTRSAVEVRMRRSYSGRLQEKGRDDTENYAVQVERIVDVVEKTDQ
jgi:hypothetical protein